MPPLSTLSDVLSQLEFPFTGETLFDQLSDIVFFIKNERGEYVAANDTLVKRCGLKDKSEIIGLTPSRVFAPPLGNTFEGQDAQVLKTGRPLLAQLEMHLYPAREIGWCLTSKMPLMRADGTAAGLVGVSQDLRLPDDRSDDFQHIAMALDHARANLAASPSVSELADIAQMTRFQLDRRMKRVFGLTTGQWLLKLRIDLAQRLLTDDNNSIAMIAVDCGYTDQSAFTRQFRQATGLTPRDFRTARHHR